MNMKISLLNTIHPVVSTCTGQIVCEQFEQSGHQESHTNRPRFKQVSSWHAIAESHWARHQTEMCYFSFTCTKGEKHFNERENSSDKTVFLFLKYFILIGLSGDHDLEQAVPTRGLAT